MLVLPKCSRRQTLTFSSGQRLSSILGTATTRQTCISDVLRKQRSFPPKEPMGRVRTGDELNVPTMGEKLVSLNTSDKGDARSHQKVGTSPCTKLPSADSVNVLLKQALQADDRALLLECLKRRDEKVITNSVSLLNPSDVFKLLESFVSIMQSRGAELVCALPWLRSLFLQHASSIMSQKSSLIALNTLYQLIESRISTFNSGLELWSCLDLHYAGAIDDTDGTIEPLIYEDQDTSDEGSEF